MEANLYAGWIGLLLGAVAGMVTGMFFHDEKWLSGYASWSRRMIRLGHISFFGIGFINLAFALTVRVLAIPSGVVSEAAAWSEAGSAVALSSWLLIIGAVTMPLVCYGSAWKKSFRHLFAVPALSVTVGIGLFLWALVSA
jgi:hypothetical protein